MIVFDLLIYVHNQLETIERTSNSIEIFPNVAVTIGLSCHTSFFVVCVLEKHMFCDG
jgi:hypothetical protein